MIAPIIYVMMADDGIQMEQVAVGQLAYRYL